MSPSGLAGSPHFAATPNIYGKDGTGGYGKVSYTYRMGKYDVTLDLGTPPSYA